MASALSAVYASSGAADSLIRSAGSDKDAVVKELPAAVAGIDQSGLARAGLHTPAQYLQKLQFSTILEGKQTKVTIIVGKDYMYVADARIVVDKAEFSVNSQSAGGFSGTRKVLENGVVKVDQSIQITSLAEAPEVIQTAPAIAKQMGFANWKEVKCSKGDMLMIIGDNKNDKLIGNCITPAGK